VYHSVACCNPPESSMVFVLRVRTIRELQAAQRCVGAPGHGGAQLHRGHGDRQTHARRAGRVAFSHARRGRAAVPLQVRPNAWRFRGERARETTKEVLLRPCMKMAPAHLTNDGPMPGASGFFRAPPSYRSRSASTSRLPSSSRGRVPLPAARARPRPRRPDGPPECPPAAREQL
jgi:hypothetical protein